MKRVVIREMPYLTMWLDYQQGILRTHDRIIQQELDSNSGMIDKAYKAKDKRTTIYKNGLEDMKRLGDPESVELWCKLDLLEYGVIDY